MKLAVAFARPAAPDTTGPVMAFAADAATRGVMHAAFAERNWPATAVLEGGVAAALRLPAMDRPLDVAVVDISDSANPAADIAALAACGLATRLIAVGGTNDVALFRDLLAAGAADYLVKPLSRAALLGAVSLATTPAAPAAGEARTNAVIGARGGVGTTTIAVNLAWLLSGELRKRVALLDLDLQFGSVALALNQQPGRGLREAMERPSRIDSLFLERALEKVGERLHVLAAEEALTEDVRTDPGAPAVLLHELRERVDAIVLDLPRHCGLTERAALAEARHVVVVAELSLGGVRDTLRLLALVQDCAPAAAIHIAVRDGGRGARLPAADFARALGRQPDLTLPHDPKSMQAATLGRPLADLAPKGPLVRALRPLALALAGGAPKRRGLLARWR